MRLTVLGSGTSTGIPSVACHCDTCRSTDPRDKRLRPSIMVQSDTTTVVIDTSSDFRQQMLRHDVMSIDAIVYTHHHFDHIGGFDDIRPFNFHLKRAMPIYGMASTLAVLRSTFPYAFGEVEQVGGGVPVIETITIDDAPFTIGDITFTPIPLMHGSIRVNGYRIGDVAYCTDTNHIPLSSFDLLEGLDVLILDGLRPQPHPTHFTIDEAVDVASRIGARMTYLTHIAHQVKHAETERLLPANVRISYDDLIIESMAH